MTEWEEHLAKPEGESDYHLRRFYPVLDADKEVKLVIGYGLNITQRKQYEQQIRITEKRYNSLFNFSQFLINTHDLDGMLLSINPAALKFLGYTAEEMIGHNIGDFIATDTDFSFDYYLHSIRTNNKAEGILPVRCKDGHIAHLLSQVFKVEEPGTQPYMIGFAQDISERIRTEQLLISAKQLAEKTTKAKGDFMAKVSHEIRTPLNGILGVAGLLSKTQLDPQQEKYMTVLQESGQNLLSIINDLLDIEKIVSGKMLLEHVSFDLNEKMEILIESFRSRAGEKKLGLSYQTNIGRGEYFSGDPFRITQVLNNLLSNAVKFTLEGSVSLVVTARKDDGEVLFEVVDSGIGIPADKLTDIYEPFIQTHIHTGIREMGTGLGLTICRELVELMSGTIHVNSNTRGTVFTVALPLRTTGEEHKPVKEPTVKHNYSMVHERRFLLAEDVELNQFLISEIMYGWGASLVIANNGQEAVDLLKQQDFDLILMDIQMPVLDGMEATRLIRQLPDPYKRNVPVIALTANTFVAQDNEYLLAGMNDFLSKPFSEKKLYDVICGQLNGEKTILPEAQTVAVPVSTDVPLELDFTYLREVAGDNQPFIDKMVRSFRDNTIRMLEDLKTFEGKEDWAEMAAVMHKLKFSVNTMGIHTIKYEVIDVESILKTGPDHASALPRVEGLRKRLLELTARL
jgi:PAS domain S-box-containing protein